MVPIQTIRERLKRGTATRPSHAEEVATILEQSTQSTIDDWPLRVELEPHLIDVPLSTEERCAHLPQLFRDFVFRFRNPWPLGTRALVSASATSHGLLRANKATAQLCWSRNRACCSSAYSKTLQNNLFRVDFSLLLLGVMAIADEVDSQLAQAMASYISESKVDLLPPKLVSRMFFRVAASILGPRRQDSALYRPRIAIQLAVATGQERLLTSSHKPGSDLSNIEQLLEQSEEHSIF
jgi:hypothetical protein